MAPLPISPSTTVLPGAYLGRSKQHRPPKRINSRYVSFYGVFAVKNESKYDGFAAIACPMPMTQLTAPEVLTRIQAKQCKPPAGRLH